MTSVWTAKLPHYEAYPAYIALFKEVKNAAYLRSQLLAANPEFDYAFLDASMIISTQHLLSATFIALHAFLTSRQKTRTPHSELVFRLSPNNNIGESYRIFGLTDSTTNLIAVKLSINTDGKLADGVSNKSVSKHLGEIIEGMSIEIEHKVGQLGAYCDVAKVSKVYKLGRAKPSEAVKGKSAVVVNGSEHVVNEKSRMESVILGIMALKGS